MAETEAKPPETTASGPGELKSELKSNTPGRTGKPALKCPKCGKDYHKQAGIRARERHEVDCKGEEGPLFVDSTRTRKPEKEVKRPPKKDLYYCPGCQARFYAGTVYCPGCGEEIEWP